MPAPSPKTVPVGPRIAAVPHVRRWLRPLLDIALMFHATSGRPTSMRIVIVGGG